MKKLLLLINICLLTPLFSVAQSGVVYDNLSLKSKILKSERKFSIYLPPDYNTSNRRYPVLYLLHGSGDDHTGWVQFGEVLQITDGAIKEGKSTPMIIVMPDAYTGRKGYFNYIDKEWQYEDFFFEELIPHIEKNYRTKNEKRYRAVAGLSMGGGGSFMYALHHPGMFACACPMSGYIGPKTIEFLKKELLKNNENYPDSEIEEYFKNHNALSLIRNSSDEKLKSVNWFIDCGDDDFLYEGNSLVHIELKKRNIPHEYRVRDGKHNWTYWRQSLPLVLEFVTKTFHQY